MTTRTISIPADYITALVAVRPVIGDASNHPGQVAAIAALDYLAKVLCDAGCRCKPCCADKFRQVTALLDQGVLRDQQAMFRQATSDEQTEHESATQLREQLGLPEPAGIQPAIPTTGDVGHLGPLAHVLKDRRKPIADLFGFESFSWCYYADRKVTSLETMRDTGSPLIVEITDDACAKQSHRLYGLVSDELNGIAKELGIATWWTPHVVDVLRGYWIPAPKDVRTKPHAFKVDQSGRLGPPQETCAICWKDPRNELHHRVTLPNGGGGGGVVILGGGTAGRSESLVRSARHPRHGSADVHHARGWDMEPEVTIPTRSDGTRLIVDDPHVESFIAGLFARLTLEQQLCVEFGFRSVVIERNPCYQATEITAERHAYRQRFLICDDMIENSWLPWPQIARAQCHRMSMEMTAAGSARTPLDQVADGILVPTLNAMPWDTQRELDRWAHDVASHPLRLRTSAPMR